MTTSKTDTQTLQAAATEAYLTRCDIHYCLQADLGDAIDAIEVRSVLRRVLERCERVERMIEEQLKGEEPPACTACEGACRLGDAP